MLPIRDHNPSERTPYVTYVLIAINIAVFAYQYGVLNSVEAGNLFLYDYAFWPALFANGEGYTGFLTHMFLHGGFMHLAGNMLFLYIFGDNMEDELGHVRFLVFYIVCGFAAAYLQYLPDQLSRIPMVGASGAIAGVMGGVSVAVSQGAGRYLYFLHCLFSHPADPVFHRAGRLDGHSGVQRFCHPD